jgi:hypothetical protein
MKSSGQIPLRFLQPRSAQFSLPIRKKSDPAGSFGLASSDKKYSDRIVRDARHRHR